jgi:hypothetical protein
MKTPRGRKVVVVGGLFLLIGMISIVQVVNGRYVFTPEAVSDFGFRLESTYQSEDGWVDRTYVSDRPVSEVSEAFVREFEARGYEVERSSYGGFETFGFNRAGWVKAALHPIYDREAKSYSDDGSEFVLYETDVFIRRAIIVFGIKN